MPRKAAPKKKSSKDVVNRLMRDLRKKAEDNEIELSDDNEEHPIDLDESDDDEEQKFKKTPIKKPAKKPAPKKKAAPKKSQTSLLADMLGTLKDEFAAMKDNLSKLSELSKPPPEPPAAAPASTPAVDLRKPPLVRQSNVHSDMLLKQRQKLMSGHM